MLDKFADGSKAITHAEMLSSLVRQFKGVKVAVLGDPMLDYYHFGHVDRVSPEAPVPVFIEDKMDLRDGGAGNVVANLAALGCMPIPLFPPAPYTMKHRYLVGSQQLFRIDRDKDHSEQCSVEPWFSLTGDIEPAAFVISDYAKGWCSPAKCKSVISWAARRGVPVVVDPKGTDWSKYTGATVICPNDKEMQGSWNGIPYLVHKRGPKGLRVYHPPGVIREDGSRDRAVSDYAARARHVFDVTGAGDTVVAVLAAALAIRSEIETAAELANIAAGIVVGEVGTTPCSAAVLLAALGSLGPE